MARKTTPPPRTGTRKTTPRGTTPSAAAALRPYEAKRSFDRTPEPRPEAPPRGKAQRPGGSFVVQKHDATRLHYDLRLELDGVLKSWAVTRGPSLVPGDKRLAVRTEDHPMKYLDFEGVIPAGEYGGGTMIVWDRGQWTPDADPRRGFAKGHLDFTLDGERLKGRWHLVRMRPRPRETTEQWLLIKGDDEFARAEGDPDLLVEEQTSLRSGKTNDELAAGGVVRSDHAERQSRKAAAKQSARAKDPKRPGPAPAPDPAPAKRAKPGLLPVFVDPMLATLTATPPTGGEWIHEIKFDGYRIQARLDGSQCLLLTRKGLDWTQRFASIATALKDVPAGSALIDGEVIVEASTGVSDFSALQADLSDGRQDRMVYAAFDLLYLEGKDLRRSPLGERRRLLEDLFSALPAGSRLRFSEHVENDGATMLRHACRLGLEGIVSKRRDAPLHLPTRRELAQGEMHPAPGVRRRRVHPLYGRLRLDRRPRSGRERPRGPRPGRARGHGLLDQGGPAPRKGPRRDGHQGGSPGGQAANRGDAGRHLGGNRASSPRSSFAAGPPTACCGRLPSRACATTSR